MKTKNGIMPKNRIKQLREKRSWSGRELARRVGTSAMHMNRLENGKSPLTKDWILRLAAVFEVNTSKVADVPMGKQFTTGHDDTLLGAAIGWLLEYSDKQKIKLSRQELSKWASHIYKEAAKRPLNYQQTCYLAETIILVIKATKEQK